MRYISGGYIISINYSKEDNMKANKAQINFIVDIILALGLLVSVVSGLVLLFNGSSGYMGGRNPEFGSAGLIFPTYTWKDIHTWSSIVMAAGVFLHLVLHWNWISCMTKKMFKREVSKAQCVIQD